MSESEKRMAGSYEIINSVHIGNKEVVLGVNKNAQSGKYYCGYCETCEILELFTNGATSDSYPAIVNLFAERISEAAKDIMKVIEKEKEIVGDDKELTIKDCIALSYEDNLLNKVVVIKGDAMRPEYQRASHQLLLVTGGNGAHPNARGRKIFTKRLLDGQDNAFYRQDVLGVADVEKLPEWAKDGYNKAIKSRERGER